MAPHPHNLRIAATPSQSARSSGFHFSHLLPVIAATPSRHHEHALLVRQIEKFLRLHLSFQPDRVQIQVANVAEFGFQPRFRFAQQHVRRPSGAANQQSFAIDREDAMRHSVHLGSNLPDSESRVGRIRNFVLLAQIRVKAREDSARPSAPATKFWDEQPEAAETRWVKNEPSAIPPVRARRSVRK